MFFGLLIVLVCFSGLHAMERQDSSPVSPPAHHERKSDLVSALTLSSSPSDKDDSPKNFHVRPKSANYSPQALNKEEKSFFGKLRSKSLSKKNSKDLIAMQEALQAVKKAKKVEEFAKAFEFEENEHWLDENGNTILYIVFQSLIDNPEQIQFYDKCINVLLQKKVAMSMIQKQGKECLQLLQQRQKNSNDEFNKTLQHYEQSFIKPLLSLTN